MKVTEAKLLQMLGAVSQFIIPIYQRTYSWTLKECQQLWTDIHRADEMHTDLLGGSGAVVHVDEGLGNLAVQVPKPVITQGSAHAPKQRQNGSTRPTP